MQKILLAVGLLFTFSIVHAQNVAINADASLPDSSAMLDIKHPNKGLLIPRVALGGTNDVATIPNAAVSLIVYNNNTISDVTPGFYSWNGTSWVRFNTGSQGNAWRTSGNAGTIDGTDFIGTTDNVPFNVKVNGQNAGRIDHVLRNAFWGYQAGNAITTGYENTASGSGALQSSIAGSDNTATGFNALNVNSGGGGSTATGAFALKSNTFGSFNVANGVYSMSSNTIGNNNAANGSYALAGNTEGYNNVANGSYALGYNTTGYNNVANGYFSLYSNQIGINNTADGTSTLQANIDGNQNTAIGASALFSNTSGNNNTATGMRALNLNTTGSQNNAYGINALINNTTAFNNNAFGSGALSSNTTGSQNNAFGTNALSLNNAMNNNNAFGFSALFNNTGGSGNSAFGTNTLFNNTGGTNNTAYGSGALQNTSTGSQNTAVGVNAFLANQTGSRNTAIGYAAAVGGTALSNATAIGAGANVNTSNKIRLGDNLVTVIEGQVSYSVASDKRFKYNIHQNVPGLAFIKKLTPVTYFFDAKKLEEFTKTGKLTEGDARQAGYNPAALQLHTGFLAQDVEAAAKELGYTFDGVHAPDNDKDHYSIAYSQFIMPLVKAVQEQQEIIEQQKSDINSLKAQMAEMRKAIEALQKK